MRYTYLFAVMLLTAAPGYAKDADPNVLSPKEAKEGFVNLFDGKTLNGWQGDTKGYVVENGTIVCKGEFLYTAKRYANFIFRFEFKLPPAGNNGVGLRTPLVGNPTFAGMEIQILDDGDPSYKGVLQPYQMHGSIYGVVPANRGALKPVGQWNQEEIVADGSHIKVTVNGKVVVDADISKIDKTVDHAAHPGLHNAKGYIAWLGHGDPVAFRHIRVKTLP